MLQVRASSHVLDQEEEKNTFCWQQLDIANGKNFLTDTNGLSISCDNLMKLHHSHRVDDSAANITEASADGIRAWRPELCS
jgi:hypothetical protein